MEVNRDKKMNKNLQHKFATIVRLKGIIRFLIIILLWSFANQSVYALEIEEAIALANENSVEIQIEKNRSEYVALSKIEAVSEFLPNASYNYRDGKRKTRISNLSDKQDDQVKTLNFNQSLFKGFSSVLKFRESILSHRSAQENLNFVKNEIALKVADSYMNILKYQQINDIIIKLAIDYKKLLNLADKKLSLKDIDYGEYSSYELNAKKNEIEGAQNDISLNSYKSIFSHFTNSDPHEFVFPKLAESITIVDEQEKMDDLVNLALNQNPKIKSTNLATKAKKTAIATQVGKLMPEISLNYQAETQKSSYYFDGQDVRNRSVYLNFAIPIFQSGIEYSSIAKAHKESQIASLENQLYIKEIRKGIIEEYHKFLLLQRNLFSSLSALESSNKALVMAKKKLDKKDIGMMEYLLKEIENFELLKQMIIIKCDYFISYYNIKFLTGEINVKN